LKPSSRMQAAGLVLPPPPAPTALFVNARRTGDLLYVSGQAPREPDGTIYCGKVGTEVTLAAARHHARLTGLNVLSVAQAALGDVDQIVGVVKLLGMVNAAPNFTEHSKVIDGCSELFHEVLGEAGAHARSSIGVGSLPNNITVEIEAIFAIQDEGGRAAQ
jgi:enamine deaminase RidA (YjgF/YER057c/UK114 family)